MRNLLIGAWFWVMGLTVTIVLFCVCMCRQVLVRLKIYAADGRKIHEVASIWGRAIMALTPGWSITVEGREHLLPDGKACIIVANHESMCDIFAMYYLGIQFRWLSKAEVFHLPFVGYAMRWAQYVPVKRGDTSSQKLSMDESKQRLSLGIPMFFFPEGTRSEDGRIKEFKSGAFRLARDLSLPVVPVAIHGARDMLRKGSGIPGKSHVKIRVLPPMPAPGPDDLSIYIATVRQQIINAHQALL